MQNNSKRDKKKKLNLLFVIDNNKIKNIAII